MVCSEEENLWHSAAESKRMDRLVRPREFFSALREQHTHTCRESECNQVMATVSPGGLCEQTLQDMLFLHREVLDVLQQHHACCS